MVGDVEKGDVPERCERAKDKLYNTEAEYVLQKEEFRSVELHIRQHVAHQGIPAIWSALGQERLDTTVSSGLPRVIWLLSARDAKTLTRGTCRYVRERSRKHCDHTYLHK